MSTHFKTLLALVGLVVGIVVSDKTEYGTEVAILAAVLGLMQMVIYLLERRKWKVESRNEKVNNEVRRFSLPLACGIFSISVFLMILRVQLTDAVSSVVCEKSCTVQGVISSTPVIKNEYQVFSVAPDVGTEVYDISVKTALYPRYVLGDRVSITGVIDIPHVIYPHGSKHAFEYEKYLHTKSVGSETFYPKITKLHDADLSKVEVRLQHLKSSLINIIETTITPPASSLASGMLFGGDYVPREMMDKFRIAGVSHIVVLSGYNIAIVIGFVLFVLTFLPLYVRIVAAFVVTILFVIMVGAEPSVVRATCMACIGLLALLLGRGYVARQALLLSLGCIILYDGSQVLYDASLHLSFLATAGIIYMHELMNTLLGNIRPKALKELLATSMSAYISTLPYVMYMFGTVSVYALVANMLIVSVVPIMMLMTLLVIISSYIAAPLTLVFGYGVVVLGGYCSYVVEVINRLPYASVTSTSSFMMMAFMYSCICIGYVVTRGLYTRNKKDETLPTKNDTIVSEIISY
jgi:competence protein ComEC